MPNQEVQKVNHKDQADGKSDHHVVNRADHEVKENEDASLQDESYSFDEDNTDNEEFHDSDDDDIELNDIFDDNDDLQ